MPPKTKKTSAKAKRAVTYDSDSDSANSGAKYNQPYSSDSSDDDTHPIIKQTKRMPMPKLPMPKLPDAPANGQDPRPLVTREDMAERDQHVHLECRIFDFDDYFILGMDMPNCDGEIKCTRFENNKKSIKFEWDSSFSSSAYMEDLLCSGAADLKDQSKLQLHSGDMFVKGMAHQMKKFIGSERIQVPPKTIMVVDFERPVKATPSPILTTDATGLPVQLAGIFRVTNGSKKHFFVRFDCDDVDATRVNVESNRVLSPMR
jgi:hypothetical protein